MNVPLTPLRFIRYAEQQFPARIAVVCGEERFTYAQYADRVARLGGALRSLEVQPGDRVAFLAPNCHRLLEAYYGVLEAGAVLLPLNVRLAATELAYIVNDAEAVLLFVDPLYASLAASFRKELTSVRETIPLSDHERSYESLLAASPPLRRDIMSVDEDSLAELFYTSGTSANPKGVMLTHRNIFLHALEVAIACDNSRLPVHLHTIPLFHANGWGAAHAVTFAGGKHVMSSRYDCDLLFRLVEEERVETMSLVPAMATALVNSPHRAGHDLSSLRWISIGGAASSPTLLRDLEAVMGCECFAGYGLTETSPLLTIARPRPGAADESEAYFDLAASTGYPVLGAEVRVVDHGGADVPADGKAIGEIVARSDGAMAGYWRQPEATAEALAGGWFHTGDMAVIRTDGSILIVDRKKDIIVSGGENISSLEVEKTLLQHPAVYEVAVIPVPDEKWGEAPKALVVLKPGATAGEAELIEFCRSRLAHYKCPRSAEFLDALPRTGTGKVLKRQLREPYWRDALRPTLAASKGSSE